MPAEKQKYTNSKRIRAIKENFSREEAKSANAAVELAKTSATSKFDESIDIAIHLSVDPRQADQNIRKVVTLPNGTGKDVKVACIVSDDKTSEAKTAGADIVGGEELIDQIAKDGGIDAGKVVATPDMMPKLGKIARILGPKGLMPNPKLGTVTEDVANAVKEAKAGQVELRADKNGVIHSTIGKASFDAAKLQENFKFVISTLTEAKPKSVKGKYYKSIFVSSTMGPSQLVADETQAA